MSPRPLTDSEKDLIAVGEEIERGRRDTPVVTARTSGSSDAMEKLILKHEKDCWGAGGPLGRLQEDVNNLKSYVKAVGIVLAIMQGANLYKSFTQPAPQPIQIMMPKEAHAKIDNPPPHGQTMIAEVAK